VFTRPGSQIWPTLVSTEDELEALVASFQTAYEKSSGDVCAFPGVRAMLEDLRRDGVSIAVVTSKARRRYAPDALHADLADLVDVSICAEDADGAKPDPRPLLRALERLEVAASQAIMVGDTPVDIAAGIAAGTRTIGVEWGHAGESELLAAGADAVARDPRQVCAFVLAGAAPSDTAGARSDASGSVT
jgi:HAD superfamily hydrolase (TIGR01509 family)